MSTRIRICVALMFWMAVAGVGVLAVVPGDSLPQELFGFWDKAQHVLAFAVMAVLGILAYPGRWFRVAFGLLLYGLLIEFVQSFLPWRSAEVLDVVADFVGVAVGRILGYYLDYQIGIYRRRLAENSRDVNFSHRRS